MAPFHLALINPNTTRSDTDAMVALARGVLPADAEVLGLTARRGSPGIEDDYGHVAAAAEVVALMQENAGHDAYLIACFNDPGINAARELTTAPVVGIGHCAYLAASLVSRRFAVITTLRRGIPALEDSLSAHGLRDRCVGVLALERGVREQGHEDAVDPIVEATVRAVEELGAEAVVLACGAMASTTAAIAERVRVPVCDGVTFGAGTAHALWRAGLGTSARGSLAAPEDPGRRFT
jgi:allantoin racemase